jgi:uncharacterized membrane protein
MNNAPNPNTTSIGMDGNLAALLSYLVGIIGIIILITEKENKFAKYHALQALLFHLSFAVFFVVAFILLFILGFVGVAISAALGKAGAAIGAIFSIILMIVWFALIIIGPLTIIGGNIYAAIQAHKGRWFKLPIVGNMAVKILKINV